VSTPDRAAVLAAQESWARGKVHRPEPAEDSRTHRQEVMASHEGRPTVAQQDRTHGAGLPAEDRGKGW
jgi:hypothetical protein